MNAFPYGSDSINGLFASDGAIANAGQSVQVYGFCQEISDQSFDLLVCGSRNVLSIRGGGSEDSCDSKD